MHTHAHTHTLSVGC